MPEAAIRRAVYVSGNIVLNRKVLELENILLDTGALHSSYISYQFVTKNKHYFAPHYAPELENLTSVYLADGVTKGMTHGCVRVELELVGSQGEIHSGTVTLQVLEMTANQMIIGLPELTNVFSKLFLRKFEEAVYENTTDSIVTADMLTAVAQEFEKAEIPYGTMIENPWANDMEDVAIEEQQTPDPCAFSYALHYMEMSVEDATVEFLMMVNDDKHVLPEFAAQTPVKQLLRTKGIQCFVPQNWTGINGLEPLELSWRDTLPAKMKPAQRHVNPRLLDTAKKEFERLKQYMYVDSNSDICSPIVIAPKATKPFIRYCGDYVKINLHIETGHQPIPDVQKSLEKIWGYRIFVDLDMVNSFHQVKLADKTSQRLSVQTPWGQVRPLFMPEGIGPASGVLQATVASIFHDFVEEQWAIVIFDNFLVCAHDYDDAYKKLERVIDRCIERNLFLKFSKSWLGFDYANFFGYVVRHEKFELSQERKDEIMNMPFPGNTKSMQSFLGSALFFKAFMPHYSTLCAPLNDTIKKDFEWKDRSSWKQDYEATFNTFKHALQDAMALHYPDYTLPWVLRVDASTLGVAAALLMRKTVLQPEGTTSATEYIYIPIAFASQKFSPQAHNWTIIEQEAYSCYFGIKKFEYYLRCKEFVLETDHNNLIWMEASSVPKVIRWRIYMQAFNFRLRHIPGKFMKLVDHNSRHFPQSVPTMAAGEPDLSSSTNTSAISQSETPVTTASDSVYYMMEGLSQDRESFYYVSEDNLPEENGANAMHQEENSGENFGPGEGQGDAIPEVNGRLTPLEALKQCHNSRVGHGGIRKTWLLLNKHFPGHRMSYKVVMDFVSSCPICQKDRLTDMKGSLTPLVRHLKRPGPRSRIGVDTLTITPPDIHGNKYLLVIVNHFTKLTMGYPSSIHNAVTTAGFLYKYFCTYGVVDEIISDPGIEFMNEVVEQLTKWFGIMHTFSLVDRHESNGVERTNREILRHLKALVMDERVKTKWSDDAVLPAIFYIINSSVSSESGVIPFHATFGNSSATYMKIPETMSEEQASHEFIRLLNKNLELITELSKKFQDNLVSERTKNSLPENQNQFQEGDFVFLQIVADHLPEKMHPKFKGPYKVIYQAKNDVECRDLINGNVQKFHVERLKLFFFEGSYEDWAKEAFRLAQIDNDQHVVVRIIAYKGDPKVRTSMEFNMEYYDGSTAWRPYGDDVFQTIAYEEFCNQTPELMLHKYRQKEEKIRAAEIRKSVITTVNIGDKVYVDLRQYSQGQWYDNLPLADRYEKKYVMLFEYQKWQNDDCKKIWIYCSLNDDGYYVDHLWIKLFGSVKVFDPGRMILIDEKFVLEYPEIATSERNREEILQKCRDLVGN